MPAQVAEVLACAVQSSAAGLGDAIWDLLLLLSLVSTSPHCPLLWAGSWEQALRGCLSQGGGQRASWHWPRLCGLLSLLSLSHRL